MYIVHKTGQREGRGQESQKLMMVMTKETQLMGKKVSNAEAWKKKE